MTHDKRFRNYKGKIKINLNYPALEGNMAGSAFGVRTIRRKYSLTVKTPSVKLWHVLTLQKP
jgi:hypothetical protein